MASSSNQTTDRRGREKTADAEGATIWELGPVRSRMTQNALGDHFVDQFQDNSEKELSTAFGDQETNVTRAQMPTVKIEPENKSESSFGDYFKKTYRSVTAIPARAEAAAAAAAAPVGRRSSKSLMAAVAPAPVRSQPAKVKKEEIFPSLGPFQCEICECITETKQEFVAHIKSLHKDMVDEAVLRSLEIEANKLESIQEEEATNHVWGSNVENGQHEVKAVKKDCGENGHHQINEVTKDRKKKKPNCAFASCQNKGRHRCCRCKAVFYCHQDCLSEDWPHHKMFCDYVFEANKVPDDSNSKNPPEIENTSGREEVD